MAPTTNLEKIAAQIAAMPEDALKSAIGGVMRVLAPRSRGRDVVLLIALYGRVVHGHGSVVTTVDRLAIETGLTRRSTSAALAALVRGGVALTDEIDERRIVVTLPGLLTMAEADEDDDRQQFARPTVNSRVLH